MKHLNLIGAHLAWFVERAEMRGYGPDDNGMWVSSLDLHTGRLPEPWDRPDGIEARCYRWIESPGGSNAYWDGPLVDAMYVWSERTGDARYAESARRYVRDFLDRCVAGNGLFWWGNHYFFDARRGTPVRFGGNETPVPVDLDADPCELHETRPLRVPWERFWEVDPEATEKSIRAQAKRHIVDRETGEHNRHADRTRGHAFLESGAILAESLCWLAAQVGDDDLVDLAQRIGTFNFAHRNETTGLMSNSPTKDRWDMHMTTSEVGFWAGSMLRCAATSGNDSFREMAVEALGAWVDRAWSEKDGRYFGKLMIKDGSAVLGEKTTRYQPGDFCDPWEPLFPAHDYAIPCAEACLDCYTLTSEERFLVAVERWVQAIARSLPAGNGRGGYAEHYGRCISFLVRAAEVLGRKDWRQLATTVADEAVERLGIEGRFRTHPGEDRCDAVDGMGFLVRGLMALGNDQ